MSIYRALAVEPGKATSSQVPKATKVPYKPYKPTHNKAATVSTNRDHLDGPSLKALIKDQSIVQWKKCQGVHHHYPYFPYCTCKSFNENQRQLASGGLEIRPAGATQGWDALGHLALQHGTVAEPPRSVKSTCDHLWNHSPHFPTLNLSWIPYEKTSLDMFKLGSRAIFGYKNREPPRRRTQPKKRVSM